MTCSAVASRADPITNTDSRWRAQLTPEQCHVTRQHGTEGADTSPLNGERRDGMYSSVSCAESLFASASVTAWPSFGGPASPAAVSEREGRELFARPTEVRRALTFKPGGT
jgi:peptide-methionine (R)-S-oxide reductase